jgi:hypothetical protein
MLSCSFIGQSLPTHKLATSSSHTRCFVLPRTGKAEQGTSIATITANAHALTHGRETSQQQRHNNQQREGLTMTINSDLWVLEWSQRGNVFHVQPLANTLSFNRKLYRENTKSINDYRVLLVGSNEECSAAADSSRRTLIERENRNVQAA